MKRVIAKVLDSMRSLGTEPRNHRERRFRCRAGVEQHLASRVVVNECLPGGDVENARPTVRMKRFLRLRRYDYIKHANLVVLEKHLVVTRRADHCVQQRWPAALPP